VIDVVAIDCSSEQERFSVPQVLTSFQHQLPNMHVCTSKFTSAID
jgi:hypothetical protein